MRVPIAQLASGARRQGVVAVVAAALLVAGCSTSATQTLTPSGAPAPTVAPTSSGNGNATISQLIPKVTAAGIDCSDAHSTGMDPGANDQVVCGGIETIEIETFPSAGAITDQFVPYLQSFSCNSSPDDVYLAGYLAGSNWVIYSVNNNDVIKIGASMGVQPTKLCT